MSLNTPTRSKINWTAGATFVVALAVALGVPTEYHEVIYQFIATCLPVVIWVLRTWFTGNNEE